MDIDKSRLLLNEIMESKMVEAIDIRSIIYYLRNRIDQLAGEIGTKSAANTDFTAEYSMVLAFNEIIQLLKSSIDDRKEYLKDLVMAQKAYYGNK